MLLNKNKLALILLAFSLNAMATPIQQYDDNPQALWRQKLRQLNQGEAVKFRIVQLGDSHTAGGFLTDQLRLRLQQQWGNGGIGWVFPNSVSGQRTSTIRYDKNQWKVLSSSKKEPAQFTLGGVITRSQGVASLGLDSTIPNHEPQNITLAMRPTIAKNALQITDATGDQTSAFGLHGNVWQYFSLTAQLPIRLQADLGDEWEIGAINIENQQNKGVIVSALGINGSQLSHWQKWRSDWQQDLAETQADLVILEYGTNESFNDALNLADSERAWQETIQRIRSTLPDATVLIMGAPESLKSQQGQCGTRPAHLNAVQSMQQRLAQQEKILFWSWQDAMGGACSMNQWVKQKWAGRDGVHFSATGYARIGDDLANAIIALAQ